MKSVKEELPVVGTNIDVMSVPRTKAVPFIQENSGIWRMIMETHYACPLDRLLANLTLKISTQKGLDE